MNNVIFYGTAPTNFKNILGKFGYTTFPSVGSMSVDEIIQAYPSTIYPIVIVNKQVSSQILQSFNIAGYILWFCKINHFPSASFKQVFKGATYGYQISTYNQKYNTYFEEYIEDLAIKISNVTTSDQVINPTPSWYQPFLITKVSTSNLPGSDGIAHSAGIIENAELSDGSFLRNAVFWVGGIIDAVSSTLLDNFFKDLLTLSQALGVPPYYVSGSVRSVSDEPLVRSLLIINTKNNKTIKILSNSDGSFRADLHQPDPVCIVYVPEGLEKPDVHYGILPKGIDE